MSRSEEIKQLVAELDSDDTDVANEAEWALINQIGEDCLEELIAAAPAFADFGRLCASEVFRAVGDHRAVPVLAPWLEAENQTVRAWAADALGAIGSSEAVPHLQQAWRAAKNRGEAHDDSEQESIRSALTELGARSVVLPDTARSLSTEDEKLRTVWSAADARRAVELLAAASQVVYSVSFWERESVRGGWSWFAITDASVSAELDWTEPWDRLVATAAEQLMSGAVLDPSSLPPSACAALSWVDRSDL